MLGQKSQTVFWITRIPNGLQRAGAETGSGDANLIKDMSFGMKTLRLARFTEIEVGAVGTAVPDATNRGKTTSIAETATVNVGIPTSIVLGNAKEQTDDVLPSALLLMGEMIVFIIEPVLFNPMFVGNGLAIVQRTDGVAIDVLVESTGLSRRVRGVGWLALVAAGAGSMGQRASTMANSIATVQVTVRIALRIEDAVGEVDQSSRSSK